MEKRFGGAKGTLKRLRTHDKVDPANKRLGKNHVIEDKDACCGTPYTPGTDLQESGRVDLMVQSDVEFENRDDSSDTHVSDDISEIRQPAADSSKRPSSFNLHLGHTLTEAEVDALSKRKWKFEWKVPAVDTPTSKWVGTGDCFLKEINESSDCGLKQKLFKHWLELYKSSGGNELQSSRRRRFFSHCNSYRDILHCSKRPFYLQGSDEDSSITEGYIMHALNHVFRTRDLVTRNETKLAKLREDNKEDSISADGFRDHGFTRPKVLILLPLASIALRVVRRLIQLTPFSHRVNVEHMDRFSDEYGTEDVNDDDDMNEPATSKPLDFQALFGGNNNDRFMIGIKFTKRSVKLYSDFYSSDVIVASPLGLFSKIAEAKIEKERDVDYLSSIEVLIIDHADVVSMQNWSYVTKVVDHLNNIPSKLHGTDVMRVRPWYLDGHARFYRQTILLGSFLDPDMDSLFSLYCLNYQGKVKLVTHYKGVLSKVLLKVPQTYVPFDATSTPDYEARLDYFVKKVFPKINDSVQGGIMIFISSYLEFVRIRNFLKSQNASFCMLGEYMTDADISRARLRFFEGRRKIMLYTERCYFFKRYKIRGIKNLIFYSLPEREDFYPEILNMIDGPKDRTCTVLYSHFDKLRLGRIAGTSYTRKLMSSKTCLSVFY